jgi:hypothetical protein
VLQAKGSRGSPPGNNKQLEIFFSIFNIKKKAVQKIPAKPFVAPSFKVWAILGFSCTTYKCDAKTLAPLHYNNCPPFQWLNLAAGSERPGPILTWVAESKRALASQALDEDSSLKEQRIFGFGDISRKGLVPSILKGFLVRVI